MLSSIHHTSVNSPGESPLQARSVGARGLFLQRQVRHPQRAEKVYPLSGEHRQSYLDLVSNPGAHYQNALDSVRRQLLEAFYTHLLLNIDGDAVQAVGKRLIGLEALHDADRMSREFHLDTTRNPLPTEGGSILRNLTEAIVALLYANGLSKPVLVGRTGLEPVTDGL